MKQEFGLWEEFNFEKKFVSGEVKERESERERVCVCVCVCVNCEGVLTHVCA